MTEKGKSNSQDELTRIQGSAHDMASWRHAQGYLREGRHAPALAGYRKLLQKYPRVPQLWTELAVAASGVLDFAQADEGFQRAAELSAADAALLVAIGLQCFRLRRLDQAMALLRRAVVVDPSSIGARLRLAKILERSRRWDEALECVETGLAQHPKDGRLLYFKAFLLHGKGLKGDAETALRDLTGDESVPLDVQSNANYLMAAVLDSHGQYAEALTYLDQAKTMRRKSVNAAAIEQTWEKEDQMRRKLLAALTPETLRRWREEAAALPGPHPLALLTGHPRSGTTLMEQILGAHPGVLVFDEDPSFANQVLAALNPPPPASPLTFKSLDNFTTAGRGQLTGRYFKSLLYETPAEAGGRLLLDKNPFTTISLHLWLRIFPLSKIVIALRDPRDTIVSCYFQNIVRDREIVTFASFERTAKYYSDIMDVWLRLRELGGFEWIETRYEDVVGNLEAEGRRVTNFLGLPWNETQAAYYETAARKCVYSPTYNEVTKPVYTRAVKRWEHYADALGPVQAAVAKYCQAFGYG